jgi:hypothetical protein
MTNRLPSVIGGGATAGHQPGAHAQGAVPHAQARRTAKRCGSPVDLVDRAVREHLIAVADVAGLRIRGGRGKVDLVQVIEPADAGVVLADAGIVQDDAAHGPFRRIEGIVSAARGPRDDDMRAMLVAHERAAGNGHDPYVFIARAHRISSLLLCSGRAIITERKRARPHYGTRSLQGDAAISKARPLDCFAILND